ATTSCPLDTPNLPSPAYTITGQKSFLMFQPNPPSAFFPYTTLFRSRRGWGSRQARPPRLHRWWCRSARHRRTCPYTRLDGSSARSEEHTSELQSRFDLVCRLLLEKKNTPTSFKQHAPDPLSTAKMPS